MRIEQHTSGRTPGGAHATKCHTWGKPIPGAGGMGICTRCGEKNTPSSRNAECVGRPATGLAETTHDYEPTP